MVRTIYVVFTNIRLSDPQVRNMKQYKFLCPYDMVQVGDMIEDDRYSQRMYVVGCTQCANDVQDGIFLKTIEPSKINGIKVICDWSINNKQIGNMEARNISVTLEQAREWYNSGNSTLRTLALNAYTESELMGYDYIKQLVKREATSVIVPEGEVKKINVYSRLAIVAKYFNGSWNKTTRNTGYFLGNYSTSCGPVVDTCNGVGVYQHNMVQYAGVIYFKNQEDAIKAVKILGESVKDLF
jgi:hypothetical protein|nr:MAG TPA: hypothetical protein [Crassvirales sp.]